MLSVTAFAVALALSMWSRINVGFVALVFAYGLGTFGAGLQLSQVMAGFPVSLFLTVMSITLVFGHAQQNGTLERAAGHAVQLARGQPAVLPWIFFGVAVVLGSLGAGNIGAVALLCPVALSVARQAGVPVFLMSLLVLCGGNGAALSPLAPTGIIAGDLMARIGLTGFGLYTYANCLLAHTLLAVFGYVFFGGLGLLRSSLDVSARAGVAALLVAQRKPFEKRHVVTLCVLVAMLAVVVFGRVSVGPTALVASVLLSLLRVSDEDEVIRNLPWGTVLMVCGMTCLLSILERTGGIDLFALAIEKLATPNRAPFVVAASTGLLSAYSSSSGVVLPTFLPILPKLVQKMGGGDLLALASSVNVGAHLVDLSPLSTLGALCVAADKDGTDKLYRQLLAVGMSMVVFGALFCQIAFGWLHLP